MNTCDSCRHYFMEYKIFTVTSLYILEVLCFIKKNQRQFQHNFHIHGYNTRGKTDLHTERCNTTVFQKTVVNMGIKLHNRLSVRRKTMKDFRIFKKGLKCLFLNNYFYTIIEFLQFYRSKYW